MENKSIADKYLTFSGESKSLLDPKTAELLVDTFDKVYLGICDFFNSGEPRNVVYTVDPEYDGIAATADNQIFVNPEWFKKNPWDIDCMTHELIHVAQNYGYAECPFWICEGLADYGRAKFGLYNKETHWAIPKYSENHSYKNGYGVTAAFFIWIEENIDASLPKDLNNTIKSGKLTANYFVEKTGKTVDELWQMYADSSK